MSINQIPNTDVVSYLASDGEPTESEVVVAVNKDGTKIGQSIPRMVRTLNGVTVAGAREIVPLDPDRTGLTIRNDSDVKMYFRTDGEAGDGVGYPMDAGRGYSFEALGMLPDSAVSVWCGTAGQKVGGTVFDGGGCLRCLRPQPRPKD